MLVLYAVKSVDTTPVGPNTKIMRKAKMSFQSGQVKQVIRTYAVEIQTSDKRELAEDVVTMKLRKAMGANCKYRQMQIGRMTVADARQMIDNLRRIRNVDPTIVFDLLKTVTYG